MELPSGTVTFLMTDVEGSTRLWGGNPDAMERAVERHEQIIEQAVIGSQGFPIKKRMEGDSHFCVFPRATDAARAATDIQRALHAETWPEGLRIKVRIALHSGDAELRHDDYFGPPVNRCARIRATAHGGQIVLSDATRRLIGDHLPQGTKLKSLGTHQLKDLDEMEHIYQLSVEGLADEFPPLASMNPAHHNLPTQLTNFIGREGQLAKVRELLAKSRLVTLLGAGGSGKTRLAIQVAAELIEEFKEGVWFINLVSLSDGKLIAQRLVESLPIAAKGRDPLEAVLEEYRNANALFLFDNCEHVARDAAALVNRLLRECPKLRVLATSREPLSVAGETSYVVPPMEIDLHGNPSTVENVRSLEAVRLFVDRAALRLSGEDILTEANAEDVYLLCKMLDGLPLAIEQAVSNLSYLAVRQIRDRIERHFSMLEMDEEGVDPRHRTIQATIDWSYGMLDETERRLFERLSVFTGGWTVEASENVCGSEGLEASAVLPHLEKLVKRSLVVAEDSSWGDKRYRLLVPIREYAITRLPTEIEPALHERHFEWHHHLALQAFAVGLDAQNGRYVKWLTAEHDNIRAALNFGLAKPELALQTLEVAVAMHRFWWRRGHLREASSYLQKAMDAAPGAPQELIADALNALGVMKWQSGQLEAAETPFHAAASIYLELGLEQKWASTQSNLSGIAFAREQFETARDLNASVVALYRKHADFPRLARALHNLGVVEEQLGNLEDAVRYLVESVGLNRRLELPAEMAKAQDSLLGVYADQGRLLEFVDVALEVGRFALEEGDSYLKYNALCCFMRIAAERSDFENAARIAGAVEVALERSEMASQVGDNRFREATLAMVEAGLEAAEFRKLVREGRAIGPDEMLRRLVDSADKWGNVIKWD